MHCTGRITRSVELYILYRERLLIGRLTADKSSGKTYRTVSRLPIGNEPSSVGDAVGSKVTAGDSPAESGKCERIDSVFTFLVVRLRIGNEARHIDILYIVCHSLCFPLLQCRRDIFAVHSRPHKHTLHRGNGFYPKITYRQIERRCVAEHSVHIGNLLCIPIIQMLIERRRSAEHIAHIGYTVDSPIIYIISRINIIVYQTLTAVEHTAKTTESKEIRLVDRGGSYVEIRTVFECIKERTPRSRSPLFDAEYLVFILRICLERNTFEATAEGIDTVSLPGGKSANRLSVGGRIYGLHLAYRVACSIDRFVFYNIVAARSHSREFYRCARRLPYSFEPVGLLDTAGSKSYIGGECPVESLQHLYSLASYFVVAFVFRKFSYIQILPIESHSLSLPRVEGSREIFATYARLPCYTLHIPIIGGYLISSQRVVEKGIAVEHLLHIGYRLSLPLSYGAIGIYKACTVVKSIDQVGTLRKVGFVGSRYVEVLAANKCAIKRLPFGSTPLLYEYNVVPILPLIIEIYPFQPITVGIYTVFLPHGEPYRYFVAVCIRRIGMHSGGNLGAVVGELYALKRIVAVVHLICGEFYRCPRSLPDCYEPVVGVLSDSYRNGSYKHEKRK